MTTTQWDRQRRFLGIYSAQDPMDIPEGGNAELVNADISQPGMLQVRGGMENSGIVKADDIVRSLDVFDGPLTPRFLLMADESGKVRAIEVPVKSF